MDALARQRIQIGVERGDERFALARAHLGDLALVQRDAADELHVEVAHPERAPRRLAHERERLGQQHLEILRGGVTLFELGGLRAQRVVAQGREARLERIGGRHEHTIAFEQPLSCGCRTRRP